MTDYEKLNRARHALEEFRADLSRRIAEDPEARDLISLHTRVSRAIKALSGQG
jgi:hypothetical protein